MKTKHDDRGRRLWRGHSAASESGSALLVVLALATLLLVTVTSLVTVIVFQTAQERRAEAETRATSMAQQGMESYLLQLKSFGTDQYWQLPSHLVMSNPGAATDGTWTVVATPASSTVVAVGVDSVTGMRHTIVATVRSESFAGDYTVLTDAPLTLGNAAAGSNVTVNGDVRSNSTITLAKSMPGARVYASGGVVNPSYAQTSTTSATQVDFSQALQSFPTMLKDAGQRLSSSGTQQTPLSFYRFYNNWGSGWWGNVWDPTQATTSYLQFYSGMVNSPPADMVSIWINPGYSSTQLLYEPVGYPTPAGGVNDLTHDQKVQFTSHDPAIGYPQGSSSSGSALMRANILPSGNNVVYVGGDMDAFVGGYDSSGRPLTYYNATTIVSERDIYIMGPIVRAASASPTATLGLVAKRNIIIMDQLPTAKNVAGTYLDANNGYYNLPYTRGYSTASYSYPNAYIPGTGDVTIQAALLAINGGVFTDPANATSATVAGPYGPPRRTGTLTIQGSIAAKLGLQGVNFANEYNPNIGGWTVTTIGPDPVLQANPPFDFPSMSSGTLKVSKWQEYTTGPGAGNGWPTWLVFPSGVDTPTADLGIGVPPNGDTLPPITTSDMQVAYATTATISFTATDGPTGSGVAHTFYSLDDSAPVEANQVVVPGIVGFSNGYTVSHHISWWSIDAAGNIEGTNYGTFTMFPDTTPPLTTIVDDPSNFTLYKDVVYTPGNYSYVKPAYRGVARFTLSATDNSGNGAGTPYGMSGAGSGVAHTYYQIDGGNPFYEYTTGTVITVQPPTPPARVAIHTITFYSVDNAGVVEGSSGKPSYTFWISNGQDQTPPGPTTAVINPRYWGAASPSWTASDTTNGTQAYNSPLGQEFIWSTFFRIDGGTTHTGGYGGAYGSAYVAPPTDGWATHTLEVWAVDYALNEEPHKFFTWQQAAADPLPPVTTSDLKTSYFGGPAVITLTPDDSMTGNSGIAGTFYKVDAASTATSGTVITINPPGVGTASHTIEYWSTDNAGNTETHTVSPVFTITAGADTTAPGTAMVNPKSVYYGDAVISLTASDNVGGAGVANTFYTIDSGGTQTGTAFTVVGPASGSQSHTITYWSVDRAVPANTETAHSFTFTSYPSDTAPPTTTSDWKPWYTGAGSINLTANDSGSGVAATYYKLDTADWVAGFVIGIAGEGTHTLQYYSVDRVPNIEPVTTKTFGIDSRPPTTTCDAGPTYVGTATISLTATDVLSGVATTCYRVDLGTTTTLTPGNKVVVTGVGSHRLDYWSTDVATNKETSNPVYFTITAPPDTTAPNTVATNLQPYYTTVPAVISLTASDNVGGAGLKYTHYTLDSVESSGTSISTSVLGSHTITYWSVDLATPANAETPHSYTFIVDNQAPTTSYSGVTAGANYSAAQTVTLVGADTGGSGLASTHYILTTNGVAGADTSGTSVAAALPASGTNNYTVTYYSIDKAGNRQTNQTVSFSITKAGVETTPPVSISDWPGGYYSKNSPTLVNITATDAGSGVKNIQYQLNWGAIVTVPGSAYTLSLPGPGWNYVYFWAQDNALNLEPTHHWLQIDVDPSPPVTTPSGVVEGGTYMSAQVVQLNAGDLYSGVASTHYILTTNGLAGPETIASSLTAPLPATAGATNAYTVTYWSVDNAGNRENNQTLHFWITAPPAFTTPAVLTPVGLDTYNQLNTAYPYDVNVSWTAPAGSAAYGPFTYQVHMWAPGFDYRSPWISGTSTAVSVSSDGVYQWTVESKDKNGTSWGSPAPDTFNNYLWTSGSCPFLYTWNGSKYAFEADEYSVSKLGLNTAKGFVRPNPLDYHILANTPQVQNGSFEFKLVEERLEADYLDQMKLYTIDAPADRQVITEGAMPEMVGKVTGLNQVIHTVARNLQPPPVCTWVNTGQDVRDQLSASDGNMVVLNADRNAGFTYQTLELDLGNVQNTPQQKLVIDGRSAFPTTPAGRQLATTFGARVKLQVQDALGNWVSVPTSVCVLPKLPEFTRPFVMDLSHIWISDSRKVRLTWLFKTYVDSILLDTTADEPVTIKEVTMESANLQPHGFDGRNGVGELYSYVYGDPVSPPNYQLPGNYTKFGDVTPLLSTIDDKFVIFGGGDELTLRFTPPADSPAIGQNRSYLALFDGYYKDLKQPIDHTIAPLPFAAMSNFPYGSNEHYPNDADHLAYLAEWNTRFDGAESTNTPDFTPPTTTSDAKTWYSGPAIVNLIPSDSGSGVGHTYYILDGGQQTEGTVVGIAGAGTHTLEFWSVDVAGNVELTHTTISVGIDMGVPTTISDAVASYQNTATITLTPGDTGGSGLAGTYYVIDNGQVQTGTTIVVSTVGSHHIAFWSADKAGNVEAANPIDFTVTAAADTAPPSSGCDVVANYNTASPAITFTASDTGGSGVAHVYYKLDGTLVTLTPPNLTFNAAGEGSHTLEYWAVDAAGNAEVSHHPTTFRIDTVAPVTTAGGVTAGANYTTAKTVTFSALDVNGSGISSTHYVLTTNGAAGPDSVGSSVTAPMPAAGTTSNYTVTFYSVDIAGNREANQSVSFSITAPAGTGTLTWTTHGYWEKAADEGPVAFPTTVTNSTGTVVYSGNIATNSLTLPPGTYTINVQGGDSMPQTAVVTAGNTTTMTFWHYW